MVNGKEAASKSEDRVGQHDQSFKNLILDYLRASLEFFVRDEAAFFTPDVKLEPVREEQIKEWFGERGTIMDVPVRVTWPNGEQSALLFCLEHNTNDERNLLKRHLLYCVRMSIEYDTERIVPVAIFPHAERPVREVLEFSGGAETYLRFKCVTVRLQELFARDYLHSDNIVARLCLPLMKTDGVDKYHAINQAVRGLDKMEPDWQRKLKYLGFLAQYSPLDEAEFETFWKQCVEGNPLKEAEMTIADVYKRQGQVEYILRRFRSGKLSADEARLELEDSVAANEISRQTADKALATVQLESQTK